MAAFQIGESGSVTLKAVLIGVIVLLLLVPLGMLRGLVTERSELREQAYARVAEGWGGSAVLGGPMLVVVSVREEPRPPSAEHGVQRLPGSVRGAAP